MIENAGQKEKMKENNVEEKRMNNYEKQSNEKSNCNDDYRIDGI